MSNKHEKTELEKEFELERLILFSDAVFAIAITLLVIDIKFPEVHEAESYNLGKLLRPTVLEFGAFAFSFFVIGRAWSEHLKLCRHLKRYDQGLITRNLVFLFFIVIFPFAASGISGHIRSGFYFPIYFYMANLTFLSIFQFILCRYVFYQKPHLSKEGDAAGKQYLYIKTKYEALMQVVITLLISLSVWYFSDKVSYLLLSFIPIPLIGVYVKRKIKKYKPATD